MNRIHAFRRHWPILEVPLSKVPNPQLLKEDEPAARPVYPVFAFAHVRYEIDETGSSALPMTPQGRWWSINK